MQFDKTFDGIEQAVAQAAFVRAASAGRDQIDITFPHRLAVFGEGHAPAGTLAFGKAFVRRIGKPFAFEHRNHQIAIERLRQVIVQASLVDPGLDVFGLLNDQRDGDAGHQHGFAAQQMRQLGHRQRRRFEVFGVRPGAYRRAAFAVALARLDDLQLFDDIAARKNQPGHAAFAVGSHLQPPGQRIRDAHPDAVQAA